MTKEEELKSELDYVRTIKDSAEKTLEEVRKENMENIKELKKLRNSIKDHLVYEEKLEKENKILKATIEEKDENCYWLRKEVEKLKEELSMYDREYFDEDKKYKNQKKNILMGKI